MFASVMRGNAPYEMTKDVSPYLVNASLCFSLPLFESPKIGGKSDTSSAGAASGANAANERPVAVAATTTSV